MTNSVTFPPDIGGDGSTFTDDADPSTGLAKGGHRVRLIRLFSQAVAVCQWIVAYIVSNVATISAYAASAIGAPGTNATSTSNVSMPIVGATFTITIQTGKLYTPGQKIGAARTGFETTTAVYGTVQSYNSGTGVLVILVEGVVGSGGPYNAWTVGLSLYGVITSRQILVAGGMLSGGGSLAADRTITLTPANAADAWGNNNTDPITGATLRLAAAKQTLAYAATLNPNFNLGHNIKTTLTGNAVMGLPTNIWEGLSGRIEIAQDGTGNRLITAWNNFFEFDGGAPPVLSTVAGKIDVLYYDVYDASGSPKAKCSFKKAA